MTSNGLEKKKMCTYMQSSFCLVVQNSKMTTLKKKKTGGIVDKNPPASARGHGCDPWSWIIPYAKEQLSPGAITTEGHVS